MPRKQSGAFVCAFVFLLIGFIVSLFNIGFGVTLIIVDAFLLVAYLVINFLEKQEKGKEDEAVLYASSESVSHKDKLCSEFEKLVTEIAYYHARSNVKLHLIKDGELKERVLVSLKDVDNAFIYALKDLYEDLILEDSLSANGECDKESLLEKIKRFHKKYESLTP